jgi:hypothetical protein
MFTKPIHFQIMTGLRLPDQNRTLRTSWRSLGFALVEITFRSCPAEGCAQCLDRWRPGIYSIEVADGIRKIRMIERIEELGPQFHSRRLAEREALDR